MKDERTKKPERDQSDSPSLENLEQFRRLAELCPQTIFINRKGRVVYANKKCEETMGYTKEEFYDPGFNFMTLVAPEYAELIKANFARHLSGEEVPAVEYALITKGGTRIEAILAAKLIHHAGESAILGIVTDITEQKRAHEELKGHREQLEVLVQERTADLEKTNKELRDEIVRRQQAEQELRRSEKRYRDLVENLNEIIYSVDTDGLITYVSPVAEQLSGYSPSELVGRPFTDLIHPEDLPSIKETFQSGLGGVIQSREHRFLTKSGETRWGRRSSRPVYMGNQVIGLQGVLIDITEQKQAEEALRLSEENFRNSLDTSPLGIRIVTADGEALYANSALLDLYGYGSVDELRATPVSQRYTTESYAEHQVRKKRRKLGLPVPDSYGISIVSNDGEVRHLRVYRKEVIWAGRTEYQTIYENITLQKHAEEELKALAHQLIIVQEEVRSKVAHNLHDETIQELLLVIHRLHDIMIGTYGQVPKHARERLVEVRGVVEQTINDIRGLAQNLRPYILDDMGLVPALRWLVDRLTTEDGIHAEVHVEGEERRLPADTELALFRIAQEALSNVRRHSGASTATVIVKFGEHKLTMSISDNGRGFEPPLTANHFTRQGKHGLAGIGERIRLLGGSHKVKSEPGKGTVVRIEVAA